MSLPALVERAVRDPEGTLRAARSLIVAGRDRAVGWHAVARAMVELGTSDLAVRAAHTALGCAEPSYRPEVRLLLAWIELDRGDVTAALAHLGHAPPDARAACVRGLAHCATGDYRRAEDVLVDAVAELTGHWLANALCGLGIVRSYLRRLVVADADFATAAALFETLGARERAASCVHNRGFVALRAGDIPRALALFDQAEQAGLRVRDRAEALVDRANALLAGGLVGEATDVLTMAARALGGAGRGTSFAEATLALGQCALRSGDLDLALRCAVESGELFRAQRRGAWAASADALRLRVLLPGDPGLAAEAERVAGSCPPVEAAELRLGVGTRHLLGLVAPHRGADDVRLRALGWLATARLADDLDGVLAACRTGLAQVDVHTAGMGAVELQAGAAELGGELADTGLAAALERGTPAQVLTWTERYRAATLRLPAVRPPRDPALVELRARSSRSEPVADLERQVRLRSLAVAGSRTTSPADVSPAELAAELGRDALLSFVTQRAELLATSLVDGVVRLHRFGPVARVDAEVDRLRFALSLYARTGRAHSAVAAGLAALRLDRLLFDGLRDLLDDRPLVLVAGGGLHALPWAALPTCAGRPVSVAPSAGSWLRAARLTRPDTDAVWIAGPGTGSGDREVRNLGRRWGGPVLTGAAATVDAALTAMDGAATAHLAAHGRFRPDAPMFSCLDLADGPLYGYDLDRLDRAPHLLVLSACDCGLSAVRASGELIGLATVVLRRGTAALIASTVPVPDDRVVDLVTALHDGLRAGLRPAAALAAAQVRFGHLGFVCLGAG